MVTKESIKELLMEETPRGNMAVGRALLALYNRQTADEKRSAETTQANSKGFAGGDAFVGTKMAEFFRDRGYLTDKQVAYWRKATPKRGPRILKYAGQLLIVAKEKEQAKGQLPLV